MTYINPDIDPMDFAIWYIFETYVSHIPYSSVSDMKETLITLLIKFERRAGEEIIHTSCEEMKCYDESKGGHFELYMYLKYCLYI